MSLAVNGLPELNFTPGLILKVMVLPSSEISQLSAKLRLKTFFQIKRIKIHNLLIEIAINICARKLKCLSRIQRNNIVNLLRDDQHIVLRFGKRRKSRC